MICCSSVTSASRRRRGAPLPAGVLSATADRVPGMKKVQPEVFLVARPQIDYSALAAYLSEVGGESWLERLDRGHLDDAQNLAEFAGKICYRAWEPGLNP